MSIDVVEVVIWRESLVLGGTAAAQIYTLSLHDALPICGGAAPRPSARYAAARSRTAARQDVRSEEHTSELQSRQYLVCRLLLEKKKTLHEVITFLVSMQISISSLQTHNVNRCGRSRHLARKLSFRWNRSSPDLHSFPTRRSSDLRRCGTSPFRTVRGGS